MINEFGAMIKIRTMGIISSVVIFTLLLLILPYHLTQISKQNATHLDVSVFVDPTLSASIIDSIERVDSDWKKTETFNFSNDSEPHWLRIKLPQSQTQENRFLVLNEASFDYVDLWFYSPTRNHSEAIAPYNSGAAAPYYEGMVNSERYLFDVPKVDGALFVYIKVTSSGSINVPIEIWSANDYIEYTRIQKLFLGMFFGYMAAMALSTFHMYITTWNRLFLMYAAYVSSIAMVIVSINGIGFDYLWSSNTRVQAFFAVIFACLTMIFITSLSMHLLRLKSNLPKLYNTLRNIRFGFIAHLSACFIGLPYAIAIQSFIVLVIITTPIVFTACGLVATRGNAPARYLCAAMSVLLLSGLSISMAYFGHYELPIAVNYVLMIGAISASLLLALALVVKFNSSFANVKHTRDIACKNEQAAIDVKNALLRQQEKDQSDLTYSIDERTLELEITLRELFEKNRELEKLSAVDPLTGLMNRRYFDKQVIAESRRSKREVTPLGIAMLDIDFFKKVNDDYGHLGGDHCLKVFANILKETIKRPADVICRYGGEEFVLILPNTEQDGLKKVLEKVRKNVEKKKILFEGQEISMTVSIGGFSTVVRSEGQTDFMIALADKRLYKAKALGRNRLVVEDL
jgi:diguanylate cyclase (GGDEF)-like protein